MRSKIRYVPADIELDLGDPGLGHPDGLEIIKRHYQQSRRPESQYNRDNPAFKCPAHEDGSNPGLYIKRIRDEWWAVHYESGVCRSYRVPAPMSDEHKYQTEYWVRAAQDAGWQAEYEHALPTGTRPDALIYGPVLTGVEVQRSAMTAQGAAARSRRASLAGVTDVWFTARDSPPWAWRVPTVLTRELGIAGEGQSWDRLPARRSVTAAGLRVISAVRCDMTNFSRCPYGQGPRGHCGKRHPRPRVWREIKVDDVAALFPAGEIVPMLFRGVRMLGSSRREAVFLVSPADMALYQELTGYSARLPHAPAAVLDNTRGEAGRIECRNNQRATEGKTVTGQPDLVMGLASPEAPPGHPLPESPAAGSEPRSGPATSAPVTASVNMTWAQTCAKCGSAPPGPGGILCPHCKAAIEAAGR